MEMNFLKEFGATKVGLVKVGSKLVPLTLWASLIWAFENPANL